MWHTTKFLTTFLVLASCTVFLSGCPYLIELINGNEGEGEVETDAFSVDALELDFTSGVDERTLTLTALEEGILPWTASGDQAWLELVPPSGSITEGTDTLVVRIDREGLDDNTEYPAIVTIAAGGDSISVGVRVNPQDEEGEGSLEGETEGEGAADGEQEGETEGENEGEAAQYLFTSADVDTQNEYPEAYDDVAAGDEGGEGEEREVVEPDVIRQNGHLLYILNQYRGLTIVDLDTETILAQVPTYGYPRDLYLVDDRAYVLVGYAAEYTAEEDFISMELASRLYVIDVSVPAQAQVLGQPFQLEGDFIDSRLVGDVLYAVNAHYEWYWESEYEGEDEVLPEGEPGDEPDGTVTNETDPDETGSAEKWAKEVTSESWVTSVNVADPDNIHVVDTLSFSGYGDLIQATSEAIFVAGTEWWMYETPFTTITYVDISSPDGDIAVRDSIEIPGWVADRFKMDAYDGVLRVVSSSGWSNRQVYLTTVSLADPGNLEGIASKTIEGAAGESLFATRFDGNRAYIVTYFTVDPLWIIDFSDPANPSVLGELEVPGWSTHIEPRGDYLIALGVDDTTGRQVKLSLFDVSNPSAPVQDASVSFGGDWAWSSAYYDVKALTILDDVIIVPVAGWDDTGYFDTLQFASYTPDTLVLGGSVRVDGTVLRSFAYGANHYGVTTEELAVIDASDVAAPLVERRVTLAEDVRDIQPLGDDVLAQVISHDETGTLYVRTVTEEGATLGQTQVGIENLISTQVSGDQVVLIGYGWDSVTYASHYLLASVDCSIPSAPEAGAVQQIDVPPMWSGYWYYYGWGPEVDMVAKQYYYDYWYGWGDASETSFILGSRLVLRCYAPDGGFTQTIGEDSTYQGLAVVDLATLEPVAVVGLGFDWITSVDAAGDTLYISSKQTLDSGKDSRPVCAPFISAFDPATLTLGPKVNVPGSYLDYTPETGLLVLEDVQYGEDWTTYRRVNTVLWDGGETVDSIDTLQAPSWVYNLSAGPGRIFYLGYQESAYTLGSLSVSATGELDSAGETAITDYWAQLLALHGDDAYLGVGGGVIARYDCSAAPTLTALQPVMSSPSRFRFTETAAYAPLGYAGVARMPF